MHMHPDLLAAVARERQAALIAEARISRTKVGGPSSWRRLVRVLSRSTKHVDTTREQGDMRWIST
jgi:hypothetical protein